MLSSRKSVGNSIVSFRSSLATCVFHKTGIERAYANDAVGTTASRNQFINS